MTDPKSQEQARWNTRFAAEDYVFGTAPNAFLASQKHRLKPGMTALCVADGEGRNSVWLAQQGLQVTAFDFATAGLEKARRLAAQAGEGVAARLTSSLADIEAWDWDAKAYDVVAVIFIQFLEPAAREHVFLGIMRAIKPGGLLILQGYTPKQVEYKTGGPPQPENMYTLEGLRSSFAALEILHLAEHEEMVDEGPGHRGRSALIDLVARRPG